MGRGSNNIHLLENGDLGVIFQRWQDGQHFDWSVPHADVTRTVVITLGIDGDHDEVHWDARNSGPDLEELLLEAIESLTACHEAIRRIRQAGDRGVERNAFELGRDYERGQQSS
jgi:hypothetical protein